MPKKFSEIEYEILRVLSQRASMLPMEITQASVKVKAGSVYAYLGRLKTKKWVRAFCDGSVTSSGTPSYRYSITGIGAARYRNHMDENAVLT